MITGNERWDADMVRYVVMGDGIDTIDDIKGLIAVLANRVSELESEVSRLKANQRKEGDKP